LTTGRTGRDGFSAETAGAIVPEDVGLSGGTQGQNVQAKRICLDAIRKISTTPHASTGALLRYDRDKNVPGLVEG